MLLEIVGNVGVSVKVNGVPIDELADDTARLPRPMEDDDDKIGGLSNENGLNELQRGAIFGSDGITKRSFTKCFVGDDFFCGLFERCCTV